jgi:prepilin-type N-terminal cleavage/methylation domain-containing protein
VQASSLHRERTSTCVERWNVRRLTDMNATRTRRPGSQAFTLIELMTVMAIMVILAGILIPAYHRIQKKGKDRMEAMEKQVLAAAIKTYFMEYGAWPIDEPFESNVLHVAEDNWDRVFRHMTVNAPKNPKDILFYSSEEFTRNADGNLVDPWSTPYQVLFDREYPGPAATNVAGDTGVEVR